MSEAGSRGPRRAFHLPASADRLDADVQEELRFHVEERVEQFVAQGMSRADAEAEVRRRFGDFDAYRSATRAIDRDTLRMRQRTGFLRTLMRESHSALRRLWRTPTFTVVAFATLALGIGATTAIYSVLDAVVLRPLPYPEADRLVSILHPATVPGSGERKWGLSIGGYLHFREHARTLEDMGLYRNSALSVTSGGDAEMATVARVTASIFTTLRATASVGRLFVADDNAPGAPRVVVLSHEYHRRRFGGDPTIVGSMLETSEGSFEIVGITEPRLSLPMPGPFASTANLAGFSVDVWIPETINTAGPFHNNHPFVGLGRLASGRTVLEAQTEFTQLMSAFSDRYPTVYPPKFLGNYNFRVEVGALRDAVLGDRVPRTLWTLFGAVLLVLVIAASNVSNLFLVRFEARRRDAAVRTALGADRTHMAAHFLSESLVLCIAAALMGVVLAAGGLSWLLAIAPTDIPRLASVSLGWRSAAVAVGIGLFVGCILGTLPLLRRGIDVTSLRDAGRGLSASPRQRMIRSGLVVAQVAMSLMLLVAAGLMIRSFNALRGVEAGFDPSNVVLFGVSLPNDEFQSVDKAIGWHRALHQRIAAMRGVTAVGATSDVPLEDYGTGCAVVFKERRFYRADEETPCVATPLATPGFLDALGITVRGQHPTWRDVDARTQAVVLTRVLADRLWPGEDPIGKSIGSNGPDSKVWYTVVGVIPELRAESFDTPPTEAVFYAMTPLREDWGAGSLGDLTYFVRTSTVDPITLVPELRRAVTEANPRVPFIDARRMTDVVERSMSRMSFIMILLGLAAGTALSLSAVGLYGVISYTVTQRRGEIGIRMAHGASAVAVVRMIMRQSLTLVLLGLAIGGLGALWLAQSMQALLFGVRATDPLLLGSVSALLLGTAGVAALIPARRAARIDPAEAMRAE